MPSFEFQNRVALHRRQLAEAATAVRFQLRAIQDQEFERVGGTRTVRTDARFIVATNRDMKVMVDENRFPEYNIRPDCAGTLYECCTNGTVFARFWRCGES